MIAMSAKQMQQSSSHTRNNSDIQHGSRRHEEFLKDQKMLAAESAIADQYATAMLAGGMGHQHARNYLQSAGDATADAATMNNLASMSQSYRNGGGVSGSHT